ncbi:MAG TPA: glycosyltransferase [Bauldia sp.]|nr:glycosyltransferase [Bauldia sp.]
MRVLFATTVIPPSEASSGGDIVSLATVDALRRFGCEVIVLGYLRPGQDAPTDPDTVVGGRRTIETSGSGARAGVWMARSLISRRPYTAEKFYGRAYAQCMRRLIKEKRIDVVVVDHTQMTWLLDWLPSAVPVWLLMHNAESELYAEGARFQQSRLGRALYRRESRNLRRLETRAAARVENIFVLSQTDADVLRAAGAGTRITVLPVMPEPGVQPRAASGEASFDVALLATWSWLPNIDALRWFLKEIHPHLPRGISVHVAGAGAEHVLGGVPGITYRGFVSDVAGFLSGAKVVAVPTRYGSGVETKMLAAIATGRPIVATPAATRGLGPLPSFVAIADDVPLFARLLAERVAAAEEPDWTSAALSWSRARREIFLSTIRDALQSGNAAMAAPRRERTFLPPDLARGRVSI